MRLTASQQANRDMLQDAMRDTATSTLFAEIEAHIEARPDVEAHALEQFSDRLRRQAWKMEMDI